MLKIFKNPLRDNLPEYASPLIIASVALLAAFTLAPTAMAHLCTLIITQISVFFSSQAA
jgi:hypothetical protein